MPIKKAVPVLFVFALGACESNLAFYNAVTSWQKAPIEEMFEAWGYPDSTRALKNAERSYIWTDHIVDWSTVAIYPDGEVEPLAYTCEKTVKVDPDGRIIRIFTSVDCPIFPFPQSRSAFSDPSEKNHEKGK